MSWFDTFKAAVTPAQFFGHFINGFDASRRRNYRCLFHDDSNPSMSVDPEKCVFHCAGCEAQGGMLDFFARVKGFRLSTDKSACISALFAEFGVATVDARTDDATANPVNSDASAKDEEPDFEALRRRVANARKQQTAAPQQGHEPLPPLPESLVTDAVAALWSPDGERFRKYLTEERGVSEQTLRKFDVGLYGDKNKRRIGFPVRDAEGRVLDVRLHSPAASKGQGKVVPYEKGRGGARLFPLQVIAKSTGAVVICEGEIDALTANQYGFPAVTAGSATVDWAKNPHLVTPFKDRDVVIAYDRGGTEPGLEAARKVAPVLLAAGATSVRLLAWTDDLLSENGGKKIDVNDFFAKRGRGREDFQELIDAAAEFTADGESAETASGFELIGPLAMADDGGGADDDAGDAAPKQARTRLDVLPDSLWQLYYLEGKQGVKNRVGVPISYKALEVVEAIAEAGAKFFRYSDSAETLFVLNGQRHRISNEDEAFNRFWHENIQLFGEKTGKGSELIEGIEAQILLRRDCVRTPRADWGRFDREKEILYICLDPGQAEIIRIAAGHSGGSRVEVVPNGTDGALLRCPTYRNARFAYKASSSDALGLADFRTLVHGQQALDEIDRLASTAFNLAALFPGLTQRPLRFNGGGEHSGKTTSMQDFEVVLYGEIRAAGFQKVEEFWAAINAAGPIVTQDNAETAIRKKFEESYNQCTTGVPKQFRKLFTNETMVTYRPNASLCLTAIESFTRPEDVDRAIEFAFSTRHHERKHRLPRTDHIEAIKAHGDEILSRLFDLISVAVLPGFAKGMRAADAFLSEKKPGHPKERFNEFLAMMLVICEALGGLLWDADRAGAAFDPETMFLTFLDRQRDLHLENVVASSPEVQFLDCIRLRASIRPEDGFQLGPGVPVHRDGNGGCSIGPVTSSALFTAFAITAKATGLARPYDNPRQLGQRIAAAARPGGTLEKAGWSRADAGRAHGNNPLFTFTYKSAVEDAKDTGGAAEADEGKRTKGGTVLSVVTGTNWRPEPESEAQAEKDMAEGFSGGEVGR